MPYAAFEKSSLYVNRFLTPVAGIRPSVGRLVLVDWVRWLPRPDVSKTLPIGSPTAVQGVVPALSLYRFASVLKSHRPPASPAENRVVGDHARATLDASAPSLPKV